MSDKIYIEAGSVQETLIIPLYGRKICSEQFPELYTDTAAKEICDSLAYDFSELERKKKNFLFEFAALEVAMRQLDIMREITDYLKQYPQATIVNLGCGLDNTAKVCDNGTCSIINIDLPDIISIRNQLVPEGERERNLAYDLKDKSWLSEVDGSKGVIFFAAGVFYYFEKQEVMEIVLALADNYPGGCLVFDSAGKFGVKLMLLKTLKNMQMSSVRGFFYVNKPEKDLAWSKRIKVTANDYMLGYHDMKGSGINAMHRLLAWIGDKLLKMSINRLDFQ